MKMRKFRVTELNQRGDKSYQGYFVDVTSAVRAYIDIKKQIVNNQTKDVIIERYADGIWSEFDIKDVERRTS